MTVGRRALPWVILVASTGFFAAPSAAQDAVSAVMDRGTASEGEQLDVSGSGWAPASRITISLCGNNALRGSADCDRGGSETMIANPDGSFLTELLVAAPPEPCPCVVYVVSDADLRSVRLPVEIVGVGSAPTEAPPSRPSTPGFEVTDAELTGRGPWTAWFGGSPRRELSFVLRNTTGDVRTPRLAVTWGRGRSPSRFVEPPTLDSLEPDETVRVTIPIDMDALTVGGFDVLVSVSGAGPSTDVRLSGSSYPWGLIAAAAVAVQLVLLRVRNAVRERLHGGRPHSDEAEPAVDESALAMPLTSPSLPATVSAETWSSTLEAPDNRLAALHAVASEARTLCNEAVEHAQRMLLLATEHQHHASATTERLQRESDRFTADANRCLAEVDRLVTRGLAPPSRAGSDDSPTELLGGTDLVAPESGEAANPTVETTSS